MKRMILILLLLTANFIAQDFDATFNFANKLYVDKKYEEAYEKYRQILEGGFESGQLYYNLGNTAYRLNHKGESILYYEKALKFLPDEPDVLYNLNLVRSQVVDRIEMPQRNVIINFYDTLKKNAASPGSVNMIMWGILLLGLFWSLWIYLRKRDFSRWFMGAAIFFSVLFLPFFTFWNLGHIDSKDDHRAVLLINRAEVKAEPDDSGETLFVLHEGAVFKILRSSEDWTEIQLLDGKNGWIQRNMIGEI